MWVSIYVKLNREVPDAAGEVIAKRLAEMGYSDVKDARVGKVIELELEGAGDDEGTKEKVRQLCTSVLTNPAIESFEILSIS